MSTNLLTPTPNPNNPEEVRRAIQQLSRKLGPVSEPIFAEITISGLTASRLIASDADKKLVSTDIAAWVLQGSANQVVITDEGDGTITLSTPQDIHTGASPTFAGLKLESELFIKEQAAADSDQAGYGQIWCKTATPNELWFTDDAGTDLRIVPQDLRTSASPTFVGLTLSGTFTDGTLSIASGVITLASDGASIQATGPGGAILLVSGQAIFGGPIRGATDAAYDLGVPSIKWKNLFISGDANIGTDANIGGDANVTGVLSGATLTLTNASRARGYLNTNQPIPDSTTTTIEFDAEIYDTRGEFDHITNKGRFTADDAGYYLVAANAILDTLNDGTRMVLTIRKNAGGLQISRGDIRIGSAGMSGTNVNTILYLNAGDYVYITIWHNHGAERNCLNVENRTNVSIHRLS